MSKNKKRKNSGQWIGVLIYMLIGAACGILILRYMDLIAGEDGHIGKQIMLFGVLALSVYAAMALQTVIHETGHLVFGLATGYQFSSFRIFSWMLLKENGKLRFRRLSIAGTGGQCLMAPPELKDGKMPFLLYNFGGAIMNLIASAIFFGISLVLPSSSVLTLILQVLALIGASFAVINGVPLRLGPVDNDGCNALSMMRSSEAVRAFHLQLKANELVSKGVRLKDMPAEWFIVPEDESMRNSIIASAGVLCCNRLMDEHRFEEADTLMEHLLSIESGIVELYRRLMTCDRIFVEAVSRNRKEVLEGLMTAEQEKMMKAMKQFPSVLRTKYVLALLSDGDEVKARETEKEFESCALKYPYPSDIAAERELMQIAKDRVAS